MTQPHSDPPRPHPIRERVGEGIFTDREQELAFLMRWAGMVARKVEKSIALVSPRRYGKTAILERFYNRLRWERDDVMPFYYELRDSDLWFRAGAVAAGPAGAGSLVSLMAYPKSGSGRGPFDKPPPPGAVRDRPRA